MTFEQWRERYIKAFERKHHCRMNGLDLDPDLKLWFSPKKGFMYYSIRDNGRVFWIDHTCTNDIAYVHKKARMMARNAGCQVIETITARNPASFARLTDMLLDIKRSHVYPDGFFYWMMTYEVRK